ncbi:hypothetical protein [Prevotellamassilia timonensis]|uniref:hypothetical protein n=1 Tax=Prevotellamassilia timonensis TaxID=1852370 RepID=UPI0040266BEB
MLKLVMCGCGLRNGRYGLQTLAHTPRELQNILAEFCLACFRYAKAGCFVF